MKKPDIVFRLLRIPLDFVSVIGAFFMAYFVRSFPGMVSFLNRPFELAVSREQFLMFVFQAALLLVFLLALDGGYSLRKSLRFRKEAWRILVVATVWVMLIVLYFFAVRVTFFSRFILAETFLFMVFLMLFHRFLIRQAKRMLWKRGNMRRKILVLGVGKVADELREIWRRDIAFDVVDLSPVLEQTDVSAMNALHQVKAVVSSGGVEEIVHVGGRGEFAEGLVEYSQLQHLEYRFVPDMLEIQRINLDMDFVGDIPLISLRSTGLDAWGRVLKRLFDLVFGVVFLMLLSPIFLLAVLGIKLDSTGPIFYRSVRVSRDKVFRMWKFRTMVVGADGLKDQLAEQNKRSGPLFKVVNDPRVTRFGRFLRKWSIDEFPQLLNVLIGELSLVGPRAHLPSEIEMYERHHRRVLAIKAGVTGLAQVSGRSHLDFEQEVKLDVYYLENWTIWMDLWILWRTVGTMLEGGGE